MPFVQIDIDKEIEKRKRKNSSFEKRWDESREEYQKLGKEIMLKHHTNFDDMFNDDDYATSEERKHVMAEVKSFRSKIE